MRSTYAGVSLEAFERWVDLQMLSEAEYSIKAQRRYRLMYLIFTRIDKHTCAILERHQLRRPSIFLCGPAINVP